MVPCCGGERGVFLSWLRHTSLRRMGFRSCLNAEGKISESTRRWLVAVYSCDMIELVFSDQVGCFFWGGRVKEEDRQGRNVGVSLCQTSVYSHFLLLS